MDKANKAFRRSGIRLRSVKSGHSSLKLIISDWKESKSAYKSYISNQETSWSDMVKWASSEHNRGLREVLDHVIQLQALWTDVQTQFLTALKKFQHQFESILESELQLDKSRASLNSFEQKEAKLGKELRKQSTKSSVDDLKQIEEKLADVKISIQNAQIEVASNTTENESVKMLLMKEGLIHLSNQYVELAEKTAMIFKAQRIVAATLPDARTNVQDIKYNGAETSAAAIAQAKKDLRSYNGSQGQVSAPPPPPPYYPPSPIQDSSLSASYHENPPRYCNFPSSEVSACFPYLPRDPQQSSSQQSPSSGPSGCLPWRPNETQQLSSCESSTTQSPSTGPSVCLPWRQKLSNIGFEPSLSEPNAEHVTPHYYDTPPPDHYANIPEEARNSNNQ